MLFVACYQSILSDAHPSSPAQVQGDEICLGNYKCGHVVPHGTLYLVTLDTTNKVLANSLLLTKVTTQGSPGFDVHIKAYVGFFVVIPNSDTAFQSENLLFIFRQDSITCWLEASLFVAMETESRC